MEDSLFEEIKGRIQQTDMSVPYNLKGYSYYNRYEEGKEYPIYCRKKIAAATQEEIMLEVNEMAKGHDYYAVGGRAVSTDNKILAYGVDTVSRRIYTLCFKNLETGEELNDKLQGTEGRLAWANNNKTVFYTSQNPVTLRSDKIFK